MANLFSFVALKSDVQDRRQNFRKELKRRNCEIVERLFGVENGKTIAVIWKKLRLEFICWEK